METKSYVMLKLKFLNDRISLVMNSYFKDLNVTASQMRVLSFISRKGKGELVPQKEVQKSLNLKHSTLNGLLNRMKEKDLLDIIQDQDDKRVNNIIITDKTFLLRKEFFEKRKTLTENIFNNFNEEEIIILDTLLNKLRENVDKFKDDIGDDKR
ncbi:MAG: MarR family transcriptional regulator [Acholeplasmataceae bacterium]|nr:MarR family transcriptional regulator [Acholeplasmataceae bacterium]